MPLQSCSCSVLALARDLICDNKCVHLLQSKAKVPCCVKQIKRCLHHCCSRAVDILLVFCIKTGCSSISVYHRNQSTKCVNYSRLVRSRSLQRHSKIAQWGYVVLFTTRVLKACPRKFLRKWTFHLQRCLQVADTVVYCIAKSSLILKSA